MNKGVKFLWGFSRELPKLKGFSNGGRTHLMT